MLTFPQRNKEVCDFDISYSCLKMKDTPLYPVSQSSLDQDALNLYAKSQFFYRLEYLLSKRFSNIIKTFAVQRCLLTFPKRYRKTRKLLAFWLNVTETFANLFKNKLI